MIRVINYSEKLDLTFFKLIKIKFCSFSWTIQIFFPFFLIIHTSSLSRVKGLEPKKKADRPF